LPDDGASTAERNGASGARSTSELTSKPWKSALPSSPPARSATRPCCPSCSTRSHPIRRSPASPLTVPSIPASAMTLSPPAVPPRSSRPAGTPNHGNLTQPGPLGIVLGPMADNASTRNEILRTSKRVGRTIWRRWSGYHRRSRAETKMHCGKLLGQRLSARDFDRQVAEFQVKVIRHCRLDQWRDMAHCSTASQRAARLSRKSQDKSVRGKGNRGHQQICATESPQRQR
jgi:hypothetical protein